MSNMGRDFASERPRTPLESRIFTPFNRASSRPALPIG